MVCKSCGRSYSGNYCPYCGTKSTSEAETVYWEPNNWQRALIYIGSAVLAVLCWLGLQILIGTI